MSLLGALPEKRRIEWDLVIAAVLAALLWGLFLLSVSATDTEEDQTPMLLVKAEEALAKSKTDKTQAVVALKAVNTLLSYLGKRGVVVDTKTTGKGIAEKAYVTMISADGKTTVTEEVKSDTDAMRAVCACTRKLIKGK